MQKWFHRWAPSLGSFEDAPERIWGTTEYDPVKNANDPVVFCGLYGLPDFYALWRHKGRKAIFWCGSDITHFVNGYWLDEKGTIKINPEQLAHWIATHCESYVENEAEAAVLDRYGIATRIIPSFFGDIDAYDISYEQSERPKVYASVSGNDFERYGWGQIDSLAARHPDIEFHLYGNTEPWETRKENVFVHGRVPKKQMNEEIRAMQGAIRPLSFDGFSEILAKSLLWGQWPLSTIHYPHVLSLDELGTLKDREKPNFDGRTYYREHINNYPWLQ